MNKLIILENIGFKISWKLISIGLFGDVEIPISLTHDDVLDYLNGLLTDINEQTDNIIALICEKDNYTKFNILLQELASKDNSNTAIQKRKWRAYLLKTLLDNISKDCLQGLLELIEFWTSMGMPDDCPQTFPSSGKKKTIQDYFTQSSYKFNLDKNRVWLNEEISAIIKSEL